MKNKKKTHQATKKRFKLTKTGKLMHNRQGDNAHLKIKKSRVQKARLKGKSALKKGDEAKKIKSLMNN